MRPSRNFINVTLADFILRSAYQMGKTPLLPLFAAGLGASDVLLGLIVSISTLTGMLTKPLFGILSDRQGRRWWLILGTLFFAGTPFLYRFVETPAQLVLIRVLHGTATAIYGPVTVAFVAERAGRHKAETLGWFGLARSGGYIVGPGLTGWLLLSISPEAVFTLIGIVSCVAFVPVLLLVEDVTKPSNDEPGLNARQPGEIPARGAALCTDQHAMPRTRDSPITGVSAYLAALRIGSSTPAVWLSGGLEATVYVATYATKAFLPIYALTSGYNTAQVGLFFSVQEMVHLMLKPVGGGLADRVGYLRGIALGLAVLALSLPALAGAGSFPAMLALAGLSGAAQALIFPATLALVTDQIKPDHLGAGMGLVGTLDNAGKVAGPVLGGVLIARLDYAGMFWLLGIFMFLGAVVIQLHDTVRKRTPGRSGAVIVQK